MRQFILGANVAYSTQTNPLSVAEGAVTFTGFDANGSPVEVASAKVGYGDRINLVLGRPATKGGPVILPVNTNHFSYEKSVYAASTTFSAKVTIPTPSEKGTYAIIVAKNGIKFNERNKWTFDEYVVNTITAATLATTLAKKVNAVTETTGIKASVTGAVITFTATEAGKDYTILPAELLTGTAVGDIVVGKPALNDAAYITDLANKAAADAGFNYTYRDVYLELYPNYPLNPLASADKTDTGFTVFTLRFAEPRKVKTRDEVVHQIIQVAFPTGATAIATFETKLKLLLGIEE